MAFWDFSSWRNLRKGLHLISKFRNHVWITDVTQSSSSVLYGRFYLHQYLWCSYFHFYDDFIAQLSISLTKNHGFSCYHFRLIGRIKQYHVYCILKLSTKSIFNLWKVILTINSYNSNILIWYLNWRTLVKNSSFIQLII